MKTSRVSKHGTPARRQRVASTTPYANRGNTANSHRNVLQRKWNKVVEAFSVYTFLVQSGANPTLIQRASERYHMALLGYASSRN